MSFADEDVEGLLALMKKEVETLTDVALVALEAQWQASPVSRARDDTTERSQGERSDPTSEVALDERRLALRLQVIKSERIIRQALTSIIGVRRGFEMTLDRWEGSGS